MKFLLFIISCLVMFIQSVIGGTLTSQEKTEFLLNQLPSDGSPIYLDTGNFLKVYEGPRDFSWFVVFTALGPQIGCGPCQEVSPEYEVVAKSYYKTHGKTGKIFLTVLDFEKGREIFGKFQITSAPYLYHFKATESTGDDIKPEVYGFGESGTAAESMTSWIVSSSKVSFQLSRPLNYPLIAAYLFGAAVFVALLRHIHTFLAILYQSKRFWTILSLGIIILMCSGEMWNRIRGPGYSGVKDGKIVLFEGAASSQYVIETQIVALLYATTAIFFILLTTKTKTIKNADYQRFAIYGLIVALMVSYSVLLMVFKFKHRGYPYRLLF